MAKLNTEKIKQDFPIFNQKINDETLVYLDNAATSQTPLRSLLKKKLEILMKKNVQMSIAESMH